MRKEWNDVEVEVRGILGEVASINYPSSALIGRKPRQRGRDLTTSRSIRVHCAHNREGHNNQRRTTLRRDEGRKKTVEGRTQLIRADGLCIWNRLIDHERVVRDGTPADFIILQRS